MIVHVAQNTKTKNSLKLFWEMKASLLFKVKRDHAEGTPFEQTKQQKQRQKLTLSRRAP